jgi:predicted GNAT family acetyltransferase
MSYATEDAIGIFGVTTVASARNRGYGTAITRAAILADSGLPAVLSPSPQAERLYLRLGFRPVGLLQKWWRPPPELPGRGQ